ASSAPASSRISRASALSSSVVFTTTRSFRSAVSSASSLRRRLAELDHDSVGVSDVDVLRALVRPGRNDDRPGADLLRAGGSGLGERVLKVAHAETEMDHTRPGGA